MKVLEVNKLKKVFNKSDFIFFNKSNFTVVNEISFYLNKGEFLGFIGPNGAGKTTTIQMLLGTLTPTSGSIKYFDKDFEKNRINILKKIGYANGYDRLPAKLTVMEALLFVGKIYGISNSECFYKIENFLKNFDIYNLKDKQIGSLSAGQSTMVMLIKAFLNDPKIVLLDEPTASLDPDIASEVRSYIKKKKNDEDVSLLITSHNMNEVKELCDRVLIIKDGIIFDNNTPKELEKVVSKNKLLIYVTNNIEELKNYLKELNLFYNFKDFNFIIEMEEDFISEFLFNLNKKNIFFKDISIIKPTLEDYFINKLKK